MAGRNHEIMAGCNHSILRVLHDNLPLLIVFSHYVEMSR